MNNLIFLRKNNKLQSALLGIVLFAVFVLASAMIIGCDQDTPLSVDHQGGKESQLSTAMRAGRSNAGEPVLTTREVRVPTRSGTRTDSIAVPIRLAAQGDENAVAFSLEFDPTILRILAIAPGRHTQQATLTSDTSQIGAGNLGVSLALSAGTTAVRGTRELVLVSFAIDTSTAATSTRLDFCNSPTPQSVADTAGNMLPTVWRGGTIHFGGDCAASELQNHNAQPSLYKTGTRVDLTSMRRFRDGFLQGYKEGNEYISMYYAFSKHLKKDTATLMACANALPALYKAMHTLENGAGDEVVVTPELHRSMTAILARHRDVKAPGFQAMISRMENDLNAFHGKPKNEVASRLTPAKNETGKFGVLR